MFILGGAITSKILFWRIKRIALYTALLHLVIQGTHFLAKFYPTFLRPISQFIKTCLNSASVSCVHAIPPSLVSPANLTGSLSISLSRSVMEPLNTSGLRRDTQAAPSCPQQGASWFCSLPQTQHWVCYIWPELNQWNAVCIAESLSTNIRPLGSALLLNGREPGCELSTPSQWSALILVSSSVLCCLN